jgi:type IV pilus assembly protein PilE
MTRILGALMKEPNKAREDGFTLIELLVVIVIIAIVAALALPSYERMSQQSRRSDAVASVNALRLAQETFRANCPFYAQNLGVADVCGANAGASTVTFAAASREGFYAISIVANSATGNAYTISADPQNMQVNDTDCDPMTMAFNGANPDGLAGPAACW